jgi:hypothetical protein
VKCSLDKEGTKVVKWGGTDATRTLSSVPPSYEAFLAELGMIENIFILAVRTSLEKSTIMLERKPCHSMVNIFNTAIATLWDGNYDMQFYCVCIEMAVYYLQVNKVLHTELSSLF